MKVSNEMILRRIAGETILVPVGAMARKIHGMIRLSESGALLWTALQQDCAEPMLVDILLQEYDTDAAAAAQDVREFLQKLENLGILLRE